MPQLSLLFLDDAHRELLFDPQTSGGLLVAVPAEAADALVSDLCSDGHTAAAIGEVIAGPARIEIG